MLLEFRVANFRSIGEEQILSLIPASNHKEYLDNIIEEGKHSALNVISIYGANSSGKSNLLLGLNVMRMIYRLHLPVAEKLRSRGRRFFSSAILS